MYLFLLFFFLDLNVCDEIRQQIPSSHQKRIDLYDTVNKSNL